MLPTSHQLQIYELPLPNTLPSRVEARLLADAFSEFITASSALESSYRDLQAEVVQLGSELAAQNAALEASLHENEQMHLALAQIVDLMPCGVLVLDAQAKVLRMNAEATRLLSLSGEDMRPATLEAIAACTGLDLRPFCAIEGESEISLGAGSAANNPVRWMELQTRQLSSSHAGARTILILNDITAHKQAEGDREAGRRALALAEVAATLAHEIRNPLGSLELFLSLLEEDPARSPEWIEHLRAGVRGLSGTVNNVLSFHGPGFAHLQPLEFGPAIAAAVEFARPLAEQSELRLICNGSGLPGRVLANEAAFQQIILNLVANAVRHTAASGSITVTLRQQTPTRLMLEVADTGCGIDPEHLASIFKPGWSGTGDRSGLGLAVCQSIAAQHGTVLQVESAPGLGTCFSMGVDLI